MTTIKALIMMIVVLAVCIFSCACGGGGGGSVSLVVSAITGATVMADGTSEGYSVTATGDTGITYQWAVNPPSAGIITGGTTASCMFTAWPLDADTIVTLTVTVNADNSGPEISTLEITIEDVIPPHEFGWVQAWGGTGADSAIFVEVANNGMLYTVGSFDGTVDFDPGAGTDSHTDAGENDLYISSLDADGIYQWSGYWGSPTFDWIAGIALDASDNIIVAGTFAAPMDADPGPAGLVVPINGGSDCYYTLLDSTGSLLTNQPWGGVDQDSVLDMALDGSSNIYVLGTFSGTVDFNVFAGIEELTANGTTNYFLVKYSHAGIFIWVVGWGNAEQAAVAPSALSVDSGGNAVVIGQFTGTVDFDPGVGLAERTSGGTSNDLFIVYFDQNGALKWVNTWGGESSETPRTIKITETGMIYAGGEFNSVTDFDPGSGDDTHIPNGPVDVFVTAYRDSGIYQWTATWGSEIVWLGDTLYDIEVDASGNVLTTGTVTGACDFDPGTGTANVDAIGGRDAYVNVLSSSGEYMWTVRWGGDLSQAYGVGLCVDAGNNIYVAGSFTGTIDFNPGVDTEARTAPGDLPDAYLLKLLPPVT